MSYIPTEWKTGDIVTAEKLNKLEEGVASGGGGGGVLRITMTQVEDVAYLDKTYEDITTALNQGIWPVCFFAEGNDTSVFTVTEFYIDGRYYHVEVGNRSFMSDSATGTLTFT